MAQMVTARPAIANGHAASESRGRLENPRLQNDEGDEDEAATPAKSTQGWMSAFEEPAIARVQQFIIETLKNPIRFIKSDQSTTQDVPFEPINDPKVLATRKAKLHSDSNGAQDNNRSDAASLSNPNTSDSSPRKTLTSGDKTQSPIKSAPSLFAYRISLQPFRSTRERGLGLVNRGNTCYMNATLQALLHLPPLSHALLALDVDQLYGKFGAQPAHKFDAIGEMKRLAIRSLSGGKHAHDLAVSPTAFMADLKSYARTLVKYRQEDAHEFLRFLLDAMQYCCLVRAPKSLKPFDPLRETTVVHKIFGGKLRSRVQCGRCQYNSDTFDTILDLSLDIRNLRSNTLSSALENFTETDELRGSEKYKCEKCKMSVNATKRFTIHEAPVVLTVHLKRFTLTGQKISRPIGFSEELTLTKHVMSEGMAPVKYRLCAIVHHQGGGPNSGHYVASVRGTSGDRWYEMNDSHVSPLRGAPVNAPTAYILFYVRVAANALEDVARQAKVAARSVNTNGKRQRSDGAESENSDLESHQNRKLDHVNRTPSSNKSLSITPTKRVPSAQNDDDDLGEAVAPRAHLSTPPTNSDSYESLVGHINTSPDRMPLSKKQRRKMRAMSDQHRSNSSHSSPAGKHSTLISSPYLAGQRKVNGSPHRGHAQQGAFRNRMKNRQGQRISSYH
jgi:ubiquitin carboxyl-terminal hydrolase 36/42